MHLTSLMKYMAKVTLIGVAFVFAAQTAQAQQYSERYEFIKAIKEQDAFAVREKLTNGQYPNVRDGDGVPALYIAAQEGGVGWVALLLKHEADINISSRTDRKTVLMYFAERGDTDAVKFLLGQKADPNLSDGFGETALMKAVRARKFRTVKALVNGGSDLGIADSSGRTALDHAINSRDRRLEKLLRDAEADS